ncbi:MAG: helix-turn-helix domain-containing protein, partial [Clostridium sp.]
MTQEQTHEIALIRYSVIAPLISGLQDSFPSHAAFFRDASAKGVTAPDGTVKHFAPTTIKKWYNHYNQGGFDALIPSSRADLGKPRKIDDELQEQIRYLKTNYPRMSSAAIYRQLRDNGSIRPDDLSESTVNRYLNR